jgi:hypothetical protein
MRLFFYYLPQSFWGICKFDSIGYNYDGPVCYRGEAVRHAQTGYLLALVTMQVINGISSRTKISSMYKHKLKNKPLNTAYLIEIAVVVLILYIPGLNFAFGARPLLFYHWIPPLGMFIIYFYYDEFTKLLIRKVKNPDGTAGWTNKYFNY